MANKHLHIGPGGRHCNCCFPAPGSNDRRAQYRSAKRKADRQAMREIEQELIDHQHEIYEIEIFYEEMDYAQDDFYEMEYENHLHEYERELELQALNEYLEWENHWEGI